MHKQWDERIEMGRSGNRTAAKPQFLDRGIVVNSTRIVVVSIGRANCTST